MDVLKTMLGLIQIKNWKPLTLDSISDNPDETVFNMFKEVSNGVVFKILTYVFFKNTIIF